MSQPVFVDASAWVAVTNRKDRNHKEAVQIFRRLLSSSARLVATTWTAYEALTIVKSRLGFRATKSALTPGQSSMQHGPMSGGIGSRTCAATARRSQIW